MPLQCLWEKWLILHLHFQGAVCHGGEVTATRVCNRWSHSIHAQLGFRLTKLGFSSLLPFSILHDPSPENGWLGLPTSTNLTKIKMIPPLVCLVAYSQDSLDPVSLAIFNSPDTTQRGHLWMNR